MKFSIIIFFLLIQLISSANASAPEEICKEAKAEADLNRFCIKTLQSHPKFQTTSDHKKMAENIAKLTIEKFKDTKSKIEELQKNDKEHTPDQKGCLAICAESYVNGLSKLEQVPERFKKYGFMYVTNDLSAGMDKVMTCVDAFGKGGIESLLKEENDEALNLARLASKFMETAPS